MFDMPLNVYFYGKMKPSTNTDVMYYVTLCHVLCQLMLHRILSQEFSLIVQPARAILLKIKQAGIFPIVGEKTRSE